MCIARDFIIMIKDVFRDQFLVILVLRAPLSCSARDAPIRWVVVLYRFSSDVDEVDGCE